MLVWAVWAAWAAVATGVQRLYSPVEVPDPLQPVWERLDQLPQEVVASVSAEVQSGLTRLSVNLEAKVRSALGEATRRLASAAPAAPTCNQSLFQQNQNTLLQLLQENSDHAITKIENHIDVQVRQLEQRLKTQLEEQFQAAILPPAPPQEGTSPPGTATNSSGLSSQMGLLLRQVNMHLGKITEDLAEPSTCDTILDKVSELLNKQPSAPSGTAPSGTAPSGTAPSGTSGSTCGGLNSQDVQLLVGAVRRLHETPAFLPRDCSDHHWQTPGAPTGVFTTFPTMDPKVPRTAYCEMVQEGGRNEGGWTVILRRQNSSWGLTDFNRTWEEYREGFGVAGEGEWWYGLAPLHALTYRQPYHLNITMTDTTGANYWAAYSTFRVEDEAHGFSLVVGGFSGNISMDALAQKHHGSRFSTYDRDQDKWEDGSCAASNGGGWWFNRCHYTTLTAPFPGPDQKPGDKTIRWLTGDTWLVFIDVKLSVRPAGYGATYTTP